MAAAHLPERPDLEQLRRQARELQRAVRAGDVTAVGEAGPGSDRADYPLHQAQLVLARRYGFASWARLRRHVEAINVRTWTYPATPDSDPVADQFVRLACLNYFNDNPSRIAEAADLLARHPEIPTSSLAAAAACADLVPLRRLLAQSGAAATPTGPYGWPALMYLTYSRIQVSADAATESARLLLEHGADPNDGRFFDGLPTPFTALTGCLGGGERDQPPHPHAIPLARVLLTRGAAANDPQSLYNRMFGTNDDFLELLFDFGLGSGDGGPWRRLLPDLIPPPCEQLSALFQWAVVHDQRSRVALLIKHGVDVRVPFADGRTALETALRNGNTVLAEQLRDAGAAEPVLEPVARFVAAALAGRAADVANTPPNVVDAARKARPGLIVWATGQQRSGAIALLAAAGFDVNAYGRSDLPVEQPWQTPLHTAVECGDIRLVRQLLDLGADLNLRDHRFDGTPLDWAHHFARPDIALLLREDDSRDDR